MIDIKNLDSLTPEQRDQFNNLLSQFPHLDSKMDSSRELNTPTKREMQGGGEPTSRQPRTPQSEEMDYSSFILPNDEEPSRDDRLRQDGPYRRNEMPSIRVNPEESFLTSFDKEKKETSEENKKQQQEMLRKVAEESGIPPEIATFKADGKVHPVLQKFRATLGMRSSQPPLVFELGGSRYGMRALDRQGVVSATTLAATQGTPLSYEHNLEVSIVAFSVMTLDGVPLYDVFSIPARDDSGREVPKLQREEMAATSFYLELLKSPNELVEALGTFYLQEFPPLTLLNKDSAKYMCPEANCLQTRIAERGSRCYCPVHGTLMAQDDMLPNPL